LPWQEKGSLCAIMHLALRRQTSSAVRPFYVLGLAGGVWIAVTSEHFNKPTNRMILERSLDNISEITGRFRIGGTVSSHPDLMRGRIVGLVHHCRPESVANRPIAAHATGGMPG
jgi:hypothetical protein